MDNLVNKNELEKLPVEKDPVRQLSNTIDYIKAFEEQDQDVATVIATKRAL